MTVRTASGRAVTLTGATLDAEHLDYGYALTVHRAQGATCDRTHVLAAGGGRELGYVALSRARERTTIHATADGVAQAADDLRAEWGVDRQQRWVSDTPARRGHAPEPTRVAERVGNGRELPARARAYRRGDAQRRLIHLYEDYDALHAGSGTWRDTPAGAAARNLNDARDRLAEARHEAADPDARRRDRRATAKALPQLEGAVEAAEQGWDQVGAPVADRLQTEISDIHRELASLGREAMTDRMDRLQAGGPSRSVGRGRGLAL